MPSVSVVMAVRNAARHLAPAIDSVLAQSMTDFELVIVDDGSTDDSRSIVAARGDRRVVVVDNPCPLSGYGAARALNLGIARARSDLIARMDGDDVAHPARLERQLALLVSRPDVAMVGAQGRVIDAAGRVVRPLNRPLSPSAIRWTQLIDNPFVHSAVMFRRKAVVDVGGYDEASLWMEDWDLWSRLLAGHLVLNLPDRLVDYRDHPGTATRVRDPDRSRAVASRIIARSAESVVGRPLDVSEARLLAGFGLGLERHEVRPFVTLLVRLAREFRRRDSDADRGAEPTRTLAHQLDAAAARVRPSSRAAALALYGAGIAASPGVVRWLPWSRVWGRLVVGPSSVQRFGRGGGGVRSDMRASVPRVLMVTGAYYPELSGAGLQCRRLIGAIGVRARCTVLTTSVTKDGLPAVVDGIPVHRVFVDVARPTSRIRAGLALTRTFLRLANDAEIVHFHGFSRKTIGLMALATLRRRRRVLKLTSLGHDDPQPIRARGTLAAWAYDRAHVHVGVSPRQRERYLEAGLPPDRFALIPNGVDVARFRPCSPDERAAARARLGLPADLPVVLFVGFFSHEKQPHLLFDAWRMLGDAPASTLVYVGATRGSYSEIDPALAEGMRAQAAATGLEKRVVFVGETLEIERYYRAADIFVLPSSREGLPNALLEAMASGLACIASRLPGVTDHVVRDGENGVLVPPGDVSAIADALRGLLGNAVLTARLGIGARRTIETAYTLEATAARHLEIYRALTGPGPFR